MIILIILYTMLIFVYFGMEETEWVQTGGGEEVFYIIELCILGLFVLEILIFVSIYHCLYLKDMWNLFDLIVIILSILFVLLDMLVDNNSLQGVLKIRGIFRLLRVFLLIRKLNTLRVKRELQKKNMTPLGYDLSTPLEKVLEILNSVRDNMDSSEGKFIQDLNYVIKIIQSNKLYEVDLD